MNYSWLPSQVAQMPDAEVRGLAIYSKLRAIEIKEAKIEAEIEAEKATMRADTTARVNGRY